MWFCGWERSHILDIITEAHSQFLYSALVLLHKYIFPLPYSNISNLMSCLQTCIMKEEKCWQCSVTIFRIVSVCWRCIKIACQSWSRKASACVLSRRLRLLYRGDILSCSSAIGRIRCDTNGGRVATEQLALRLCLQWARGRNVTSSCAVRSSVSVELKSGFTFCRDSWNPRRVSWSSRSRFRSQF